MLAAGFASHASTSPIAVQHHDAQVRPTGTSDGRSFIKLSDLFFKRTKESVQNYTSDEGYTGLVEVVVFERSQQDLIGYASEVRLA
jgi:hypothetical protein